MCRIQRWKTGNVDAKAASASTLRGTNFISRWYSLVLRLLHCSEKCENMKMSRYTNRKDLRRQISCLPHGSHNAVGSPSHSGWHGEHFRHTRNHCSQHLLSFVCNFFHFSGLFNAHSVNIFSSWTSGENLVCIRKQYECILSTFSLCSYTGKGPFFVSLGCIQSNISPIFHGLKCNCHKKP